MITKKLRREKTPVSPLLARGIGTSSPAVEVTYPKNPLQVPSHHHQQQKQPQVAQQQHTTSLQNSSCTSSCCLHVPLLRPSSSGTHREGGGAPPERVIKSAAVVVDSGTSTPATDLSRNPSTTAIAGGANPSAPPNAKLLSSFRMLVGRGGSTKGSQDSTVAATVGTKLSSAERGREGSVSTSTLGWTAKQGGESLSSTSVSTFSFKHDMSEVFSQIGRSRFAFAGRKLLQMSALTKMIWLLVLPYAVLSLLLGLLLTYHSAVPTYQQYVYSINLVDDLLSAFSQIQAEYSMAVMYTVSSPYHQFTSFFSTLPNRNASTDTTAIMLQQFAVTDQYIMALALSHSASELYLSSPEIRELLDITRLLQLRLQDVRYAIQQKTITIDDFTAVYQDFFENCNNMLDLSLSLGQLNTADVRAIVRLVIRWNEVIKTQRTLGLAVFTNETISVDDYLEWSSLASAEASSMTQIHVLTRAMPDFDDYYDNLTDTDSIQYYQQFRDLALSLPLNESHFEFLRLLSDSFNLNLTGVINRYSNGSGSGEGDYDSDDDSPGEEWSESQICSLWWNLSTSAITQVSMLQSQLLGHVKQLTQQNLSLDHDFFKAVVATSSTAFAVSLVLAILAGLSVSGTWKRMVTVKAILQNKVKEQDELNRVITRFVPHDFLTLMGVRSLQDLRLGDCILRRLTIMFSYIHNFQMLSERMAPHQNFQFINRYLHEAGPLIRVHNGFIDKFFGDGIMAIFADPNDATDAALDLLDTVSRLNEEGQLSTLKFKIGIGLHTGDVMMGTIGEELRMDSTIISDAVNASSRMESLNKVYGSSLLLSRDTFTLLNLEGLAYRYLGQTMVKGKSVPMEVYEIIDSSQTMKLETLHIFHSALKLHENERFAEAIQLYEEILEKNPEDIVVVRRKTLAMQRLVSDDSTRANPPPSSKGDDVGGDGGGSGSSGGGNPIPNPNPNPNPNPALLTRRSSVVVAPPPPPPLLLQGTSHPPSQFQSQSPSPSHHLRRPSLLSNLTSTSNPIMDGAVGSFAFPPPLQPPPTTTTTTTYNSSSDLSSPYPTAKASMPSAAYVYPSVPPSPSAQQRSGGSIML